MYTRAHTYTDIPQLVEAIVLPMTHKEAFENIGIQPPKGVLPQTKQIAPLLIILLVVFLQVCYCMEYQELEKLYWPEPVQLKQMYTCSKTFCKINIKKLLFPFVEHLSQVGWPPAGTDVYW